MSHLVKSWLACDAAHCPETFEINLGEWVKEARERAFLEDWTSRRLGNTPQDFCPRHQLEAIR